MSIISHLGDMPKQSFEADEIVLKQGDKTGRLMVLISGAVEVAKNNAPISTITEPGAVFGELAALLNIYHTATVRTLEPSTFYVVEDADDFLRTHPEVTFEVARKLAMRFVEMQSFFFSHLSI